MPTILMAKAPMEKVMLIDALSGLGLAPQTAAATTTRPDTDPKPGEFEGALDEQIGGTGAPPDPNTNTEAPDRVKEASGEPSKTEPTHKLDQDSNQDSLTDESPTNPIFLPVFVPIFALNVAPVASADVLNNLEPVQAIANTAPAGTTGDNSIDSTALLTVLTETDAAFQNVAFESTDVMNGLVEESAPITIDPAAKSLGESKTLEVAGGTVKQAEGTKIAEATVIDALNPTAIAAVVEPAKNTDADGATDTDQPATTAEGVAQQVTVTRGNAHAHASTGQGQNQTGAKTTKATKGGEATEKGKGEDAVKGVPTDTKAGAGDTTRVRKPGQSGIEETVIKARPIEVNHKPNETLEADTTELQNVQSGDEANAQTVLQSVPNSNRNDKDHGVIVDNRIDRAYAKAVQQAEYFLATRRSGSVVVHLEPRDLGSLTLNIKFSGNTVSADISSDNAAVRENLEAGRTHLVQQVESKGLTLGSLNVNSQDAGSRGGQNPADQTFTRQDFEQIAQRETNVPNPASSQAAVLLMSSKVGMDLVI